jgi:hypothetical protein
LIRVQGKYKGKRQRGTRRIVGIIVLLKDNAGLKYREIEGFEIFADLSFASLRSIYRNMERKKEED